MSIKPDQHWPGLENVEGTLSKAFLEHVIEETAECATAAIRRLRGKEDVTDATVIRELLSLAGFIEALARYNVDSIDSENIVRLVKIANDDYQKRLDEIGVDNPILDTMVESLLASWSGTSESNDSDKEADQPADTQAVAPQVSIEWGGVNNGALSVPVGSVPTIKSVLTSKGPVEVTLPDGTVIGSGQKVPYEDILRIAGCEPVKE